MESRRFILSFCLVASLLFNALPVIGQQTGGDIQIPTEFEAGRDRTAAFGGLLSSGREEAFSQTLSSIAGDQGDTYDALDAQAAYFYEQFVAGAGDLIGPATEKGREINRLSYEERRKNRKPGVAPRRTRSPRVYGKSSATFLTDLAGDAVSLMPLSMAFARPLADAPVITKIDTHDSKGASADDVKVIDLPDATITNTERTESTLKYNENEMSMTASAKFTQTSEAVSKTGKGKTSKVSSMEWSATFGWCPDAEGKIRGKLRARIYNQTTINTGKQLAAPSNELLLEFNIVGHVSDEAVMTHFDMEGVVSEKVIGHERAVNMGLVTGKPGFKDGSASVVYNFDNNTPPVRSSEGAKGSDSVLSRARSKIFGIDNEVQANRIAKFANWGLNINMIDIDLLMITAMYRWMNDECVEVECAAPRTALKPNEAIDVTAVSISKQDLGKIKAKLSGSGTASVTPEDQEGTPSAVYTLTAPANDTGYISVRSVSRRGIGTGALSFEAVKTKKPPVKTPPVKTPPCDGGWTGTVKAVDVKVENKQKGQDGRLVRQIDSKNESFDVNIAIIGTRDMSYGIVNNFHGNAQSSFIGTKYSESNYAPGAMSCNKQIITSPQTQKIEIQDKGEAKGKILVAIAAIGSRGHISFTAPQVSVERIIMRTYETACPSYDAVNSSTDRNSSLIDISAPMFEVDLEIDPSKPNVLKGSKTVQNSDGSETTYTWDLSRCS